MPYYRRIRDLREDHDLTQRDVAKILGMPQPQYYRYESGAGDIPTEVLIALADLYGVTADYLLERYEQDGLHKDGEAEGELLRIER